MKIYERAGQYTTVFERQLETYVVGHEELREDSLHIRPSVSKFPGQDCIPTFAQTTRDFVSCC
jgi:hypothetical protein